MALESLKSASIKLQPVKAYVKACMRSDKKFNVFCLVEAPFDMNVYSARMSGRIDVRVAYSDDAVPKHSRTTVETYVKELKEEEPDVRLFGIRDVDYSEYISHNMPDGVYGTDDRDLEMMILHSTSFTTYLKANVRNYSSIMQGCISACRSLGYIRIYDEHIGRKCKINQKVNISNVYDSNLHVYKENYDGILMKLYVDNCQVAITADEIKDYNESEQLGSKSDYGICRGHDVLSLLGMILGHRFHEPEMHKQMEKNYSKEDFYNTDLFNSIECYCRTYGIDPRC